MLYLVGLLVVLAVAIVLLVAGGSKKPTPKFKQDELRELRRKVNENYESK